MPQALHPDCDRPQQTLDSPLGSRIHVIGNSCSGKSALAARLSQALGLPLVELDALNWLPGWVGLNATDPDEFERRIRAATSGDSWIVAGSYSSFSRRAFWPQLMVWRKEDSLVWWVVAQQQRKRRDMRGVMADPAWSHLRFHRLTSASDVEEFAARAAGLNAA